MDIIELIERQVAKFEEVSGKAGAIFFGPGIFPFGHPEKIKDIPLTFDSLCESGVFWIISDFSLRNLQWPTQEVTNGIDE